MRKNDFDGFEEFNNFDVSDNDIVNPYDYDKKPSAAASRAKAIAVASTGFVIFGALVSGGAFAMTGALPSVLPSSPSVVSVDPTAAPTDSATASDTGTPTDSAVPTDTATPTDPAVPTDTGTPIATPTMPTMTNDDEGDDQGDDQGSDASDNQGFNDEGSDD